MVALAEFGTDTVSMYAAAQQLFCVEAAYAKNSQAISQYLQSFGAVLGTQFLDGYWRPSWMLGQQGPARYFVWVEGTVGGVQLALQGDNLANKSQDVRAGGYGGTFWVSNGLALDAWLLERLDPEESGLTIHFAGHSLGGSVADVAAMQWAARIGPSRVSLLTFGEPRTYATGCTAPRPGADWRFVSVNDVIPSYPSDGRSLTLTSLILPAVAYFLPTSWSHYGRPVPLAANGEVAENPVWVDPLPPNVVYGPPGEHGVRNYAGRLEAWNQTHGADRAFTDVIGRTLSLLSGQDLASPVPYLATDTIAASPAVIAAVTQSVGSGVPQFSFGGSGMSADYKQFWLFSGAQGASWIEEWALTSASAAAACKPSQPIVAARLAFLDKTASLISVSSSNYASTRDSDSSEYAATGTYVAPNPSVDGANPVGVICKWRLRSTTGGRRSIQLRGFNDAQITTVAGGSSGIVLGSETGTSVRAFLDLICGAPGYGMKRRTAIATTGQYAYNPIVSVSGAGGGGLAVVTLLNTPNVIVGQTVAISLANSKTLPGFEGSFTVLAVTGMTITVRYTVANNQVITSNCGRLRLIVLTTMQQIARQSDTSYVITTKKTAQPSKRIRAGRRARRVRNSV